MFKTFDQTDWYGMAGAERFADGSEPLVNYELKVDDLDAVAVIDGRGFYMEVLTPDGDTISEFSTAAVDAIPVMRFLATLKSEYETGELLDMGISLVNVN